MCMCSFVSSVVGDELYEDIGFQFDLVHQHLHFLLVLNQWYQWKWWESQVQFGSLCSSLLWMLVSLVHLWVPPHHSLEKTFTPSLS